MSIKQYGDAFIFPAADDDGGFISCSVMLPRTPQRLSAVYATWYLETSE